MAAVGAQLRVFPRLKTYERAATRLLIVFFSIYYFADVIIRAGEKYFWFDEIATMNICRFHSLAGMWAALRGGVDFNPLLFYVITNASTAVFGANLIGPRVPEMIAFWILCLCLFWFVKRRAGVLAGFIAMVLPTLTGAFYYAYEARPHGLVLGFCGLALICWQMRLEQPDRPRWLVLFGLCLLGACAMHCYGLVVAIPFCLAEVVDSARFRRVDWAMWAALIIPEVIACISYIPLLLRYKAITHGTDWAQSSMSNLSHLSKFYVFLVGPCILFLMLSFGIVAADRILASRFLNSTYTGSRARTSEVILGFWFLMLPVVGFLMTKGIVHGLVIDRYYLSSVIGVCILLGLAVGVRGSLNWPAVAVTVLLAFPVLWNFSALLWHRYKGVPENLVEPSSLFAMNTSLHGPLWRYSDLLPKDSRPIGVLKFYDFIYLLYYAPELRGQLYYIQEDTHDFFEAGFENFHAWAPYKFNHGLTPREFVQLAPHSWILGDDESYSQLRKFVRAGGSIDQMRVSDMLYNPHFIAGLEVR